MIKEMLGLAEGILQDLHNDHSEVASLIDKIGETRDQGERQALFEEMKTKLLSHNQAEQEVLYQRLEASPEEASREFAHEGTNEHEMVAEQLERMSADRDKMGEQWTAELKTLSDLVDHHVDEEESTGFSCAREDFSKDELEAMARQFQTRKQALMTRVA
jgi:hemerythrin-like domain-containing protein